MNIQTLGNFDDSQISLFKQKFERVLDKALNVIRQHFYHCAILNKIWNTKHLWLPLLKTIYSKIGSSVDFVLQQLLPHKVTGTISTNRSRLSHRRYQMFRSSMWKKNPAWISFIQKMIYKSVWFAWVLCSVRVSSLWRTWKHRSIPIIFYHWWRFVTSGGGCFQCIPSIAR